MASNFPENFFWGAATSAHQVEGGNFNDWSEWERKNAQRLATEAKEKWALWQQAQFPEMFEPQNYISGRASDHYHRFAQDFDIAKSLGQNAHRFSIEWSRIEPEEGKFNESEIEHYRQVIVALRQRGLEPFVTLWHWTNPVWFAQKGGWLKKKNIFYFERYVAKMVEALGSEVKFWIILNEPNVYTGQSYFTGAWPPNQRSPIKYWLVNRNLSGAHNAAYQIIKKTNPIAQVGATQNVIRFTHFFVNFKKNIYNQHFLNSIKKYQDFVGINYYHSDTESENKTDLGWPIDNIGLWQALKEIAEYQKPIYILENGLADAVDAKRAAFIKNHLAQVRRAISEGVDVRGYFYWSLLDNFEWDKGFWPRFGLVEIDYRTLERKIRPSALEYAKICQTNILTL